MLRSLVFAFLFLAAAVPAPVAAESPYLSRDEVQLARVLGPPFAEGSAEEKKDLEAVLRIQADRQPERIEQALRDAKYTAFVFADVLGPDFSESALPLAAAFFKRISDDEERAVNRVKDAYKRKRPPFISDEVKPAAPRVAKSGSYPSGHSTFGYLMALVLADMIPEKGPELLQRAAVYGESRLVLGVHFPSDIEAGRTAAAVIFNALLQKEPFRRDLAAVRREIRQALNLR